MEPDNLRRSRGRVRKSAGLDCVRFHDIRHTCVSLLLDSGVPPHVVRDIVGHSDIEVTMTIYEHAAIDEKRRAPGKPGEALGQSLPDRFRPWTQRPGPDQFLADGGEYASSDRLRHLSALARKAAAAGLFWSRSQVSKSSRR